MVTGAGAPFGRKVVRPGVVLEVPSSKIQFSYCKFSENIAE